MPQFADIAISLPIDKLFQYKIPDAIAGAVTIGHRVFVPFGSRRIVGYVVGLSDTADVKDLKEIEKTIDASRQAARPANVAGSKGEPPTRVQREARSTRRPGNTRSRMPDPECQMPDNGAPAAQVSDTRIPRQFATRRPYRNPASSIAFRSASRILAVSSGSWSS